MKVLLQFAFAACISRYTVAAILADYKWCSPNVRFNRPFLVALLADPQIGWNQDEYNSEALFREAASHVSLLQPDLVLVAGDMIQTPRNNVQFEISKSILDSIGIPYFVIAGNHDVRSTPTLPLLNEFVEAWHLPYYWYTVSHYNTLFVMLDSNVLRSRDNSDAEDEIVALAWEELDWLNQTLHQKGYRHIVPIAHHPLAIQRLEEGDRNQNTPRKVRQDLVNIYNQGHPAIVSHVFAGHFHDSARVRSGNVQYVTYPATGVILGSRPREPSGFALIKVDEDTLEENYYGYDTLPRIRPESSSPGFAITSPSFGGPLVVGSEVCIEWSSSSMANQVQLEYSGDGGSTWIFLDTSPNHGVYPWRIPFIPSNSVQLRVISAHDPNIYASSWTYEIVVSIDSALEEEPSMPPTNNGTSLGTWTSTAPESMLGT